MTQANMPAAGTNERPSATRTQHALRLLVLLCLCGDPITDRDPPGTVLVIRSELRLQALDFWLRNPDYLADQLLAMVSQGQLPGEYLEQARELLTDPEPDLRYYPMPKWHYGAYEALDDAFGLLEMFGLARLERVGGPAKTMRSQFYLTQAGVDAAHQLRDEPVLGWYVRQAALVALAASDDVGKQLKARQYQQSEYAGTELGVTIGPIAPRVRARLAEMEIAQPVGGAPSNPTVEVSGGTT